MTDNGEKFYDLLIGELSEETPNDIWYKSYLEEFYNEVNYDIRK